MLILIYPQLQFGLLHTHIEKIIMLYYHIFVLQNVTNHPRKIKLFVIVVDMLITNIPRKIIIYYLNA